jgi:KamA family protein
MSLGKQFSTKEGMMLGHELVRYKPYTARSFVSSVYWNRLPKESQEALMIVSQVLPFRTNEYVLSELIDWDNIPDDPMFRLVFPHRDMLRSDEYAHLRLLCLEEKNDAAAAELVKRIRYRMNPHPAGQITHNVPMLDGRPMSGIQHKYRETVLFFPAAGQTCHAYCTFCFRWPQFVGMEELKFQAKESDDLVLYLDRHPEVTDVLITGGDPMIMNTSSLQSYLEPILQVEHIQNIRIGTKSVGYWPRRFVSDRDADDMLRLFEKVVASGRSLSLMAHFNHPVELRDEMAKTALRRILGTGATIRMQSPVVRHINENPNDWAEMWTTGVKCGLIPYYMFVERDTGPHDYFKIPLAKAYDIFTSAYQQVSGLSRTVRGPSMSAAPGKVLIDGVTTIGDEKVFVLKFLQARKAEWVNRPFFAKFDPHATWLDDLKPAFGQEKFFFELEDEEASRVEFALDRVSNSGISHNFLQPVGRA